VRLSTRGRYAVRSMVDLAYHSEKLPISLSEISKRQDISLHYLEQLYVKLRKARLVKSVRGPGGGYLLAKKSNNISIKDILLAVNENMYPVQCISVKDFCDRIDRCVTRLVWKKLGDQIHKFFESITLKDLSEEYDKILKR